MEEMYTRTLAYGCVVKGGQSAKRQTAAFEKAGIDRIFIDQGSSDEFDWLMQDNEQLGLRPGEVIMLVCEAYLGYPGRVRRKRLEKITAKGVLVGVIGEDPQLYDTEAKIEAFLKMAKKGAQRDGAKATGPGPGKAAKARLTKREWEIMLYFWQNTRAPRAAFIQLIQDSSAAHGLKCDVTDDNLADWLGRREPNEDLKPPVGLII